jgi:hypothetical protein
MNKNLVCRHVAGLLAVLTIGCGSTRPSRTVTKSVPVGSAGVVEVSLEMGAGELRLNGGASGLMDASFHISGGDPIVEYSEKGGRGTLRLGEPDSFSPGANEWEVRLRQNVPMNVRAHLGAGEAKMVLGSLDLRRVVVEQGVGEVELDLRGQPRHSFEVELNGGVGESRIILPRSVAISARASNGIGEIQIDGLQQKGDIWINPGHENDAVTIQLSVRGGVGQIHVTAE